MKFSVDKQIFLEKINLIHGIAEKKTTMPILSTLLLTSSKNTVTFTATDLETTMTTWMEAEVEKESSIAVPAHKLLEIVRELEGKITVEEIGNSWIQLTTSAGNYKMAGLPASDYPSVPEVSYDNLFNIDSALLDEMISKTIYCVSFDDMRKNLSGICFEKSGTNDLRLVATDGHRLSLIEKNVTGNMKIDNSILVPRKGLSELRKMLKSGSSSSKQGETVQIGIANNFFTVVAKESILFSRLIDVEFPDYRQVIPDKTEFEVDINRIKLSGALRRVCLFSSERTGSVKITFDKNALLLDSSSPEVGEAKESVEVSYSGDKKEIGFSGNYLMEALESIDQEEVTIGFTDELSPVVLKPKKPKNKETYICIVMPMRI